MKSDDLAKAVARFRGNSLPGKNVYLWCGKRDRLLATAGSEDVEAISALSLPGIRQPDGAGAPRRFLDSSLSNWLQGVAERNARRSIAVIYDIAVLAFYGVGIETVYLNHASDRRMTVLCVERSPSLLHKLPEQIEYDPLAVEAYYRRLVPPGNVVEEEDNGPRTG